MTWRRPLRWAGAAAAGTLAAVWSSTWLAGAAGTVTTTTQVTVTVVQNATGVNVCAAGATCNQTAHVINLTIVIVVIGTQPAPAQVAISPSVVDFGRVGIGGTITRPVALINRGGLPAFIIDAHVSGATTEFSLRTGTCVAAAGAAILTPGHQCNLVVGFRPHAAGPQTASLIVGLDSGTLITSLVGTGVVIPRPVPKTTGPPAAPPDPGIPAPANLAGAALPGTAAASLATSAPPPLPPIRHPRLEALADGAADPPPGASAVVASVWTHPPAPAVAVTPGSITPRDLPLWAVPPLIAAAVTYVLGRVWARPRRQRPFGLVSGD